MDTLGYVHTWLTWEEQPEIPNIQIDPISGLVTLILLLTSLVDLHPAIAAEILRRGSRGDEVGTLQYQLKELGFQVKQDGIFASETYQAVIDFQKSEGLKADGIVGKQTRNALWEKTCVMQKGCRGERVRLLQKQLNNWGFSVGKVDGIFGRKTYDAVIRFQEYHGLEKDGVVDKKMTEILWKPKSEISASSKKSQSSQVNINESPDVNSEISASSKKSQSSQVNSNESTNADNNKELLNKLLRLVLALNQDPQQSVLNLNSKENFELMKYAITNENIEKEIRYQAAYIMVKQIISQNEENFMKVPDSCKTDFCTEKSDIYRFNTISIDEDDDGKKIEYAVPIDSIRLLFDRAMKEKNNLPVRFLIATMSPYIKQTPTEDIINILISEPETQDLYKDLKNNDYHDYTRMLNAALMSLNLFSINTNDSSIFKKTVADLEKIITENKYVDYNNKHNPLTTMGFIAATGNDEARQNLIGFLRDKQNWQKGDVYSLIIATDNRSVAEKVVLEYPELINRLKDILKNNSKEGYNDNDYVFVDYVTKVLGLVGEEKFLFDFLQSTRSNKSVSEELKVSVATAVYNYYDKEKGLEALMELYRKNPEIDNDHTPACKLYVIVQPSMVGQLSIEYVANNPSLNDSLNDYIEIIKEANVSKCYRSSIRPEDAGLEWFGNNFLNYFGW
ncbi:MAG: peptidoglycan-binding protein [Okeania sp. SIO2F4]|uniref:peptidoglycan-binding domain-containing protein n=1 Tax=Okeania sp. SIO2F4 TaxID=2607790 RepID=UPI00142B9E2A|nr:peptidoglycan-binding protein [Okeania sp. SIO2F4]NES04697.1 peptidoglycan-binding protein [Okeania sp. SIO2F4]